jgi:hypothetical protein
MSTARKETDHSVHDTRNAGLTKAGPLAFVSAASYLLDPSITYARETGEYLRLGVFITYNFGAAHPLGVAAEIRVGYHKTPTVNDCGLELPKPYVYGGGALRLEWFPEAYGQALVAAQLGGVFSSVIATHGELGMGYRWGESSGVAGLIGAELDASYAAFALHVDPAREVFSPAVGVFSAPFRMPGAYDECKSSPGRPLRDDQGVRSLPRVALRKLPSKLPTSPAPAQVWATRAQAEWASIPAFQALAAELSRAGAPRALVARCHAAAREERQHALLAAAHCAELAGARVTMGYSAPPQRSLGHGMSALIRLTLETWIDGCLGEAGAAACAAEEAQRATHAGIRATQCQIARDEARHAELAWDVLAFTVQAGGRPVRDALAASACALPTTTPARTARAGLDDFGILDDADTQQIMREQCHIARARLHGALGV